MYCYASIRGCSSRSDGVPLLKFAHSSNPYGWIPVVVHESGFDRHFKGWMGEVWKREFARWFLGASGRVWRPFFFQTASLDAKIAMVGSNHPFDGRMGRLGRKGFFGYNLGLRVGKRLTYADRLKMRETFTCDKTRNIGDNQFRRLIAHDRGIRSTIGRSGWKWEGRNLSVRQVRT